MPYTLHFVGLVMFIKDGGGYLVALPDGRKVKDEVCTQKDIHKHTPYLIIPGGDISTANIPAYRFISGCAVFDIAAIKKLSFEVADTDGGLDDSLHLPKMPRWRDIDPTFRVDINNLTNVITSLPVKQGLLAARVLPRTRSRISELTLPLTTSFTPEVKGDGQMILRLKNNSEVVIANVAPEWLDDVNYPDDDEHFYIYYTMGRTQSPTCALPLDDSTVPPSLSNHPFIKGGRGLRVSCANTVYA